MRRKLLITISSVRYKFLLRYQNLYVLVITSINIPSTSPSSDRDYIFGVGGSILTFPCSQIANTSPSLSLFITPFSTHILFPALITSLSTSTFSPSGTGLTYVTLSPRLTPAYCQYPGLAIGAREVVVQMSKIVAVQPPWRFPRRLQWAAETVKEKVVRPGLDEAERRVRESRKRVEAQPCGGGG
jgi:hypothetical protein